MSADGKTERRKLCPSAPCSPGHLLLGVVQANGAVDFLQEPAVVTERFSEIAHEGRVPEARFRFSAPCLRGGCSKWENGCGVAARAQAIAVQVSGGAEFGDPHCAIRPRCQWYAEYGAGICTTCQWVITERPEISQS